MRDFQQTTRYDTSRYLHTDLYARKTGAHVGVRTEGTPLGQGTSVFPKLLKGRDEVRTGPSPFPTPYYGFRFQISMQHGYTAWWSYGYYYWIGTGYVDGYQKLWKINPISLGTILGSKYSYFVDGPDYGYKPVVSAETRGRAIKSANAKLRSDSINIGQTVGEMPEAIKEFSKLVKGLLNTILALRRGNLPRAQYHLGTVLGRRKAAEAASGVSNAYLFYRFGVAPILNDVNNMASEIGKAMSAPDFIKVKGTATDTASPGFHWAYDTEGELLEVCEVGYSVRPKPHYAAAFLGLTNLVSIAWELVPLSFVANWFVSIGDTLSALDAGVGLEFVSGYQTTVVKGTYKLTWRESKNWNTPGTYDVDAFSMERKVLSAPAIPPIYLKTGGLSTGQLVTSAALLMSFVNTNNLGALNPTPRKRKKRSRR